MKLPLLSFIVLFCMSCYGSGDGHSITDLQGSTSFVDSTQVHDFIEIPFSELVRLSEDDTITAEKKLKKMGFITKDNFLYYSKGTESKHKDLLGVTGIGRFFFHNVSVVVKPNDRTIFFTFPIELLSKYKFSMVSGKNMNFFELSKIQASYEDKYNANYIEETYIDRIEKKEYRFSYFKNYAMLVIDKRSY